MFAKLNLRLLLLLLPVLAVSLPQLRAQDELGKAEQVLIKQCVKALTRFANTAKSKKVGPRAKQALDLILEYDPDNKRARSELGFRKVKGQWVGKPKDKRKKWRDKANYESRYTILEKWADTAVNLSKQHTKLGLQLKEAGLVDRAKLQLEKAVYYNPNNAEANLALGYKEGPGFYGTDAQITFAKKMKEIEIRAVEFARKAYEFEELPADQLPIEFQNLIDNAPEWMLKPTFELHGARSKRFTVWVRGSQGLANDSVMWAERAVDFVDWLIGEEDAKRFNFAKQASGQWAWQGFLATRREREEFLKANPDVLGTKTVEQGMRFSNNTWLSKGGLASVKAGGSPRHIQDSLIAEVVMDGLARRRNDGVGQGVIHAVTWYLKATSISRWGALPEGTVGEDSLALPEGTNWWMRTVRDQAVSHQDWALAQVPREKLSRFRNDCRLKSWSLMTWMFAAYPDKWLRFFLALPDSGKKVPTLEEIEAVVVKHLGKSSEVIDAEWREWARGDSGVAYGTGYGPPLLPERPSDIELAALEQINLVRSQQIGFTWEPGKMLEGQWVSLGECEMDAETSIGCDLHAKYVSNHPDLVHNPDGKIHEQDPAHEDFTRQGQQAGGGNIVTSTGRATKSFARESVDGWISTPYHRFPMLEHSIRRLGYSHVDGEQLSVSVLDMGSLTEPYDPSTAPRFVVWPANNMKNVPTSFGDPEHPNPLADQPEGEQDVTKCGYVVSLQLQRQMARILGDADIELWESQKGGRPPVKHMVRKNSKEFTAWSSRAKKLVECYKHTPKVPLNKKRDLRDVLFLLPKEPLRAGKGFQVRATLRLGGNDPVMFIWEFSTGRRKEGLKLK